MHCLLQQMLQDYILEFPIIQDFNLKEVLERRKDKQISTNLRRQKVKTVAFFLKNNYFQFNGEFKQKISLVQNLLLHMLLLLLTKQKLIFLVHKNLSLWYFFFQTFRSKRSIVFSQALRVNRICANNTNFERDMDNMKSWFQARDYPKHLF